MHYSTKALSNLVVALSLSACATTNSKVQLSENLSVAPAIDVPYSEVNANIKENIGLNVRWGGQVISSKKVGDLTELTVFASRLSKDSRPLPWSDEDFKGGQFIVTVPKYEQKLLSRYITVYGQVSGERTQVNGPRSRVIPIVTAIETQEWESNSVAKSPDDDKRGNAFYSLGYNTGHFNSFGFNSHNRFGNSFNRFGNSFNRFGNRGFGRFGRFGNRGFSRFGKRGFGGFGHRRSFFRGRGH